VLNPRASSCFAPRGRLYDRSQRSLEIRGAWSRESFPVASARVMKAKFPGVQHLARKIFGRFRGVNLVAQNGMANVLKVNANLMSAAAVQDAFDQTDSAS